jgi:surface carbohydrate biosynthesis protein
MYPVLYIPLEIAARELDAKLLVAHYALAAGLEVVIGRKWAMEANIPHMPPGLMLFKTLTMRDGKSIINARQHGYLTASIDEEVPGLVASRQQLRWVDGSSIDNIHIAFSVGRDHDATLRDRFPRHVSKYYMVGNPRWDLLRPEMRDYYRPLAHKLREQYGRFILINTNSGILNSAKGTPEQVLERHKRLGKLSLDRIEDAEDLKDRALFRATNYETIRQIIRRLPEQFPHHQFVLRPHPNEAVQTWRDFVADLPRYHISQEHSAASWIMAADALVHTSCTTGVEAFALERPAVCVKPAETRNSQNFLATRINLIARTVDETLELLDGAILDGANFRYPEPFYRTFEEFFEAVNGPFAAKRIVDVCCEHLVGSGIVLDRYQNLLWSPKRGYRRKIKLKDHNRKLMPDFPREHISACLRRFGELTQSADPHNTFTIEDCGDGVFHLHRKLAPDAARKKKGTIGWLRALLQREVSAHG